MLSFVRLLSLNAQLLEITEEEKFEEDGIVRKTRGNTGHFQKLWLVSSRLGKLGRSSIEKRGPKSSRLLRGRNQPAGERDEKIEFPTGASDDSSMQDTGVKRSSRQTKSKETLTVRRSCKTLNTRYLRRRTIRWSTTKGHITRIPKEILKNKKWQINRNATGAVRETSVPKNFQLCNSR